MLRAQPGLTVVFTTHLMDEAAQADSLVLLDQGRIVAAGRPADLMREVGGQILRSKRRKPRRAERPRDGVRRDRARGRRHAASRARPCTSS